MRKDERQTLLAFIALPKTCTTCGETQDGCGCPSPTQTDFDIQNEALLHPPPGERTKVPLELKRIDRTRHRKVIY